MGRLLDPYFSGTHPYTTAGGALYHNLTQLESVALAMSAVALVPAGSRGGSWPLAALLAAAAAVVKPTTAAVLGPAIVLAAIWERVGWPAMGRIVACLGIGAALLLLPAIVAEVPPGVSSSFDLGGLATLPSARMLVWLGLSGVCACVWIARGRNADAPRRLLALACVGGAGLAAVWTEPAKRAAANESWGLNAALVLMAPLVVASTLAATRRAVRISGAALLALHVASGALYAWQYPQLKRWGLPHTSRALLERVRDSTAPGTRLFVDMSLLPAPGYAYLARPTPFPLHLIQPVERYDAETWRLINGNRRMPPRPLEFLARRDAVVLGPWTGHLRPLVRGAGWRLAWTDEATDAQLWLKARPLRDESR
jgi:hypothetical protein